MTTKIIVWNIVVILAFYIKMFACTYTLKISNIKLNSILSEVGLANCKRN